MDSREELGQRLLHLAGLELAAANAWAGRIESNPHRVALMIEVCRVIDYAHLLQTFATTSNERLPEPDFDIMLRGWNSALGLLLPNAVGLGMVPLMPSTAETRGMAMTFLHQLGRSTLLNQAA